MLQIDLRADRPSLQASTAEPQKLFVMLKVAPLARVTQARPPVALGLVVDTSGSMLEYVDQAEARRQALSQRAAVPVAATDDRPYRAIGLELPHKLDEARKAAHALIDDPRLADDDRLALCRFDDDANVLLPLSPLADRQAAHAAVDALAARRGTRLARGLRCALEELGALAGDVAKRLVLLTDGRTGDEEECRELARRYAERNVPFVAIGIGTQYNEDLLRDLARITLGRPYHLRHLQQLSTILNHEVGTVVCEVVTDLELTVATVRGVTLDQVTRVYPSISEVDLGRDPYRLGNIAAGDFTVFILEFTVAEIPRPPSRARLVEVKVEGHVPGRGARETSPPQELHVNFTGDPAAVDEVHPEVWAYVRQRDVDEKVREALRTGDTQRAHGILAEAVRLTQGGGHPEWARMLQDALDELDRTGTISPDTRKTVAIAGRTRTTKPVDAEVETGLGDAEIRRLTGG